MWYSTVVIFSAMWYMWKPNKNVMAKSKPKQVVAHTPSNSLVFGGNPLSLIKFIHQ